MDAIVLSLTKFAAHPGLVSSQPQPHPHRGLVGVHHGVVVHPAMVAQADGSIVRLVHTEEDVDGLYLGTGQKWQLTFCYKTVQTCMYVYAVNGLHSPFI